MAVRLAHTLFKTFDSSIRGSVLICHGMFGSSRNWRSVAQALQKNGCGTICTVDMRNHGDSPHTADMSYSAMAKDIYQLVDDLNLTRVTLVGHSMGGKAVMCAALDEPDRFDRLVVLDSSPVYTTGVSRIMPYLRLMRQTSLPVQPAESDLGLASTRARLMEEEQEWMSVVPDKGTRAFLLTNLALDGNTGKLVWRANLEAIESSWEQIVDFPTEELLGATFDGPSLFLGAGKADYLKAEDLPNLQHYFPMARLLQLPQAGHWLHVDAPLEVTELLTKFVRGQDDKLCSVAGVVEVELGVL